MKPSSNPFFERRRFHRIEADIPFSIDKGQGDKIDAQTINLSKNGVLCRVEENIPMMTRLDVALFLPKEMHIQGVLVRKEKDPIQGYRMAIYFANIKPTDQKRLDEYVDLHSRKNLLSVWLLAGLVGALLGCAEIQSPTPQEILENPLGKGPLRVGMTREEVRELWGTPSQINKQPSDSLGTSHEEWVYEARFPDALPADVGYATKNKYLLFDGENLVRFHD